MKIKKLNWTTEYSGNVHVANAFGSEYRIREQYCPSGFCVTLRDEPLGRGRRYATVEEAKQAAQRDFEDIILASLE